jgi:hypothetical protein
VNPLEEIIDCRLSLAKGEGRVRVEHGSCTEEQALTSILSLSRKGEAEMLR